MLIWPAKIFGRFAFRPKLQPLEKKVAKNDGFCSTPYDSADNSRKIMKKIFLCFFNLNRFNQPLLPHMNRPIMAGNYENNFFYNLCDLY